MTGVTMSTWASELTMPPSTGRRERLHHLGAGRVAPHDGQQARDHGGHRHDLGPEPQQRALRDRLEQRRPREPAASASRFRCTASSR